jgi:type II secretory pathway component GspD/PulD (secretin)
VIHRAPIALAVALAAAAFAVGCRSSETVPEGPDAGERLDSKELQDLIARGAVRPVEQAPPQGSPATPADWQNAEALAERDALARAEKRIADVRAVQPPEAGPPPSQPPLVPGNEFPSEPENPYLLFGKRIQVYPDSGLIMKPFPLRAGTGKTLTKLLQDYGNFPLWEPGEEKQAKDQVRMELVEKWDQELFSDMRQSVPKEDTVLPVADWLIIVTGLERMKEVEGFINIFAASVPQIEIEAKIVEITLTDTIDYGVKPVDSATPIFGFPDATFVKGFNYNLPNSAGTVNSFLTLGGVQDGLAFNAVLQALATYENVSIVSSPKIAVREGVRAQFVNTVSIPSLNVSGISAEGKYSAAVKYDEVGIKLYVIPRVVGTQTVGLNIDIEASAQAGSAVTFTVQGSDPSSPGPTISNPIISKRAAQTVVYLEPGQAVILGGLVSERTVDAESKVPLLGDLPVLGYLFKSTKKRKEKTNVLFFIRPRILQGTDLNREF